MDDFRHDDSAEDIAKAERDLDAMLYKVREDTNVFTAIACWVFCLCVMYVVLAAGVFQARNPTANNMACWSHPWEVLTWQKLDKFQPREE